MRIDAIRVRNARGVGPEGLAVEGLVGGLNVLSAPNEFGKSTLFDAMRACLTVPHSHRKPIEGLSREGGPGPSAEVDLTLPSGRFRVEKAWLRGKAAGVTDLGTARVVCQGNDVDAWLRAAIGTAPADKKAEGPLGLLWVAQGGSTLAPDARGEAGDGLRAIIGEEVSAVVGGPATERTVRRTEAALAAYLTDKTRTARKQGPLGVARARLATLEAEEKRLTLTIAETQALREELARAEDALLALQDEATTEALRERQRLAEACLAEAERLDATLEGLRVGARAAKGEAERAAAAALDLARRHDAAREAASRAERAEAQEREEAATLTARRADVATAGDEARHLDEAAEASAARLDEARAAQARRTARATLRRVRGDLAEAQAAAALLAAPEPAGPPDVDAILRLTQQATEARAAARAGRPTLTLRAGTGATLDGQALTPGAPLPAGAGAVLRVGEVEVLIETPAGAEAQDAARAARAALQAALTEAGVDSYSKAKEQADEAAQAHGERTQAARTLTRLAPGGLPVLEAEAERLAAEAGGDQDDEEESPDAHGLAEAAGSAAAAATAGKQALREAEARADAARQAHADAASGARVARSQAEDRLEGLGAPAGWAAADAEAEAEARRLAAASAALAAKLAAAEAEVPDLSVLRDRVREARAARDAHAAQLQRASTERASIAATLSARYEGETTPEEDLARVSGALSAARERLAEEEAEVAALELLAGTLSEAREDQLGSFLAPVMAETAPLLDAVLPGAALSLTGDLTVSGIARGDRGADAAGEAFDGFERLSGGTREQLAILTRLGFARLMAKRGQPVPVVLDDALVYADDERIERMFEAVRDAAGDVQVIVLTCRQRAFERLGGEAIRAGVIGA